MTGRALSISQVARIEARVETHDWVYARDHAPAIDTHWQKLRAAQPALFDGRVLLMHGWEFAGDGDARTLRSKHFETDFKSFIGWRDLGFADDSVRNCFSMAALRGADGAYVLGLMGAHTSNPGQIYFPAGTPDPGDIRGGTLDLAGSALRELEEETGLDPGLLDVEAGWSVVDAGPRLGCMKVMTSRDESAALAARIEGWLSRQDRPELAAVHVARTRTDIHLARMPDFMVAWLEAMLPPA